MVMGPNRAPGDVKPAWSGAQGKQTARSRSAGNSFKPAKPVYEKIPCQTWMPSDQPRIGCSQKIRQPRKLAVVGASSVGDPWHTKPAALDPVSSFVVFWDACRSRPRRSALVDAKSQPPNRTMRHYTTIILFKFTPHVLNIASIVEISVKSFDQIYNSEHEEGRGTAQGY